MDVKEMMELPVFTVDVEIPNPKYEGDALAFIGKTYKLQRFGIDQKFHGDGSLCLYTVVDHTTVKNGKYTLSIIEALPEDCTLDAGAYPAMNMLYMDTI